MMDREQILDEVIEYTSPLHIQPNEFTVAQFASRHQQLCGPLSIGQARRRLNKYVEAGLLGKRQVLLDGYRTSAYCLIKEGKDGHNQTVQEGD